MPLHPSAALVRAVLIGASGRMGCELLRAAASVPNLRITAAVASAQSAALGRDAGELAGLPALGVAVSHDLAQALTGADVAIDFSSGTATAAHLTAACAAGKPLLIGATGYGAALEADFAAAARHIALLVAANTSLGVALLTELVARAARALPGFDIAISETHHRLKRDAPSGTALSLAAAAQAARAGAEIGIASVRAGNVIGEHEVLFAGPGEELTLGHRASDRGVFARGALAAALWLASRPPGRYAMADVLGLKTGA